MAVCLRRVLQIIPRRRCVYYRTMQTEEPPPKKLKLDESCSSKPPPINEDLEATEPVPHGQGQSTLVKLKEEDVGITEYVGSHKGFFAILKQRYSDFHVHELDLNSQLVQLTSFSLPDESKTQPTKSVLEDIFSSEDIKSIQTLAEASSDTATEVHINAPEAKDSRTLIHRAVKEHFPQLSSRTEDCSGVKQIVIFLSKNDTRSKWPSGRGVYCKFALYKENTDTSAAVGILSKLLRIKASNFQYAGMKDYRAITTQFMTAFKVSAEKLSALNRSCKNLKIGNFEYVSEPLKLGSLCGNRFNIILRRVSCDDHVISDIMSSMETVGFINYFGMQRFGTTTIPTHDVGRCLLLSDWQGAIDLILKPRPGEPEDVTEAREYYVVTKNASGTLSKLPKKRLHLERQLLLGLEKHAAKNNFLGALNFIPRNSRTMYVHSWQSYIWNKMVSWRINQYGLKPVVGDMVIKRHHQESSKGSCGRRTQGDVEYVTEENLANYSIHDVVLPLPGFDVLLPKNQNVSDYLHQLLKKDGLSIEQLKHKVPDFSLPGAYRNIVIKPGSVNWEVLHYDDVTIPLIPTDLDVIAGKTASPSSQVGKYKALKLEFTLPPATYATMMIRELLRLDTSAAYQTTLNKEEEKEESDS